MSFKKFITVFAAVFVMLTSNAQSQDEKAWQTWIGVTPVTFSGDGPVTSHFSKKTCVQFEWVYGEAGEDAVWRSYFRGGSGQAKIIIVKSKNGEASIGGDLRLHLAPAFFKSLKAGDLKGVPRDDAFDRKKIVQVGEYCLEPSKTYWAWVEKESYWLPPDGKTHEPSRHENAVLHVSDVEPKDGVTLAPLTPSTGSVTY